VVWCVVSYIVRVVCVCAFACVWGRVNVCGCGCVRVCVFVSIYSPYVALIRVCVVLIVCIVSYKVI
jgi:hypothetical protein